MRAFLLFLYFGMAIVYGILFLFEQPLFTSIIKPLPLLLLILFTLRSTQYNRLIFLGFVFSLVGDILLSQMLGLFLPGLVAFLVAHLFYIAAFLNRCRTTLLGSGLIFYLIGAGAFALFLQGAIQQLALPVGIYIFVLVTMLWRAFVQRHSTPVAIWAFVGAMLFVISDSLIGINRFVVDIPYASLLIMATYWPGQYLIYRSTLRKY